MRLLPVLLLILLAALPRHATAEAPAKAPPCYAGICEHRLDNGLTVLLYPDASQQRVLVNITYRVGSKHENYGETGMAHLLEHLLFKGTPSIPKPDQEADRRGFQWNGTTSVDRTNYFQVFDAEPEYLDYALKMEADRMVNANVAQTDLDSEMTVVRNEMEMGETQPFQVAIKALLGIAYQWHNYGKSTIGARSDVENVPIERLRDFYRRWYQPDNAVLLVAGPIDAEATLAQIQRYFGPIPKPERVLPALYTVEPPQDGERSAIVRRPGSSTLLMAGYHSAPAAHPDAVALAVALEILGNARTGRLRERLVVPGLAAAAAAFPFDNAERGMAMVYAQLSSEQDVEKAMAALTTTVEGIAAEPFTEEEVARARTAMVNQYEQLFDDVSSVGIALSEAIAAGDWRLLFLGRQQLDTVTPEAVQAAAVRYLLPANRSTVRFLPGTDPKVEVPEAPALPTLLATLGPDPGPMGVAAFPTDPAEIAARVQTVALRPGLTLHLLPKPARNQAVQLALSLQIGDEAALAGKTTALQALGAMLNRGAGELDRVAFTDAVNAAGAELGLSAGGARIEASGRGKREQLPALLDLAALALKSPRFEAGEFEQWKSQQRTALERAREQPQSRAGLALAAALDPYPAGHPYASRDLDAQAAALEALTLGEVRALHAELVGGRELVISVVGDFDAEAVTAQLRTQYADWQQDAAPAWITRLPGKTNAGRTVIDLPGQANGALQAALPLALSDQHADYPALVIADWILGGGGLSNRLATRIRQQDGLSYGAGSGLSADERDPAGRWLAYAIAAPENLDRADAAMREELARFHRDGITAAELTEAREGWLKSRRVGLGDDGGIAGSLLGLGIHRRTLADEAKLEAAVAALDVDAVNAAIRRWMQPTDWHRVLAGDAAKIGEP